MSDGKAGRPKIEINLEHLAELCQLYCNDEEIAGWLGVSVDTLIRRKHDDPAFLEAYMKGKADGKVALRRLQWESAKKGNVSMQIWLGKQALGQRDKHEIEAGESIAGLADVVKKAIGR